MSEKGTNMEPKIHLKWRRDAGNGDDWGGLGPKRCPKISVIVVWQCMEYYLKRQQEGEGGVNVILSKTANKVEGKPYIVLFETITFTPPPPDHHFCAYSISCSIFTSEGIGYDFGVVR